MKNSIIGLLISLSLAPSARAFGTPDQDPIVRDLREKFQKSSTFTAAQVIEKKYRCVDFNAGKDDFSQKEQSYDLTFREFNGYLQASLPSSAINGRFYSSNGSEIITTGPRNDSHGQLFNSAFRITSASYLIQEFSITIHDQWEISKFTSKPIAYFQYSNTYVKSYSLCVPTPTTNGQP